MTLLPVDDALGGSSPASTPLAVRDACRSPRRPGRVLAAAVAARRTQPPFAASAMDGYAVRAADAPAPARA